MSSIADSEDHFIESYSVGCCHGLSTTRKKTIFYIILGVTATVVLGLVTAVAVLAAGYGSSTTTSTSTTTSSDCNSNVSSSTSCTSSECSFRVSQLAYSIDKSVDPCDDFYKFACLGAMKNTIVDNLIYDQPLVDQQLITYKRIRELLTKTYKPDDALWKPAQVYSACMKKDSNNFQPQLKAKIDEFGGWPLAVGQSWNLAHSLNTFKDLLPILTKLRVYTAEGALFTVSAAPKMTENSKLMVLVAAPNILSVYSFPEESKVKTLAKFINPQADVSTIDQDYVELKNLNMLIANALAASPVTNDNLDTFQVESTIDDLNKLMSNQIDWVGYLNSILNGKKKFISSDKILIQQQGYFKSLGDHLRNFNQNLGRSVINLEILLFMQLMETNRLIDEKTISINNQFVKRLTVSQRQFATTKPWANCVSIAAKWLSYVVAPEYAKNYKEPSNSVESVKAMTGYMLDIYRERFNELKWFDETTRARALKKIETLKQNYNYPDWAKDAAKVKQYYSTFTVGSSHFDNFVEFSKFSTQKNYRLIDGEENLDIWPYPPLDVNAFYDSRKNSINILEAMMQPPTFSVDSLNVINFGSLGMILAHEIAHGYDTVGTYFDEKGNLVGSHTWLTPDVEKEFTKKADCIAKQYSNYKLTKDDLPGYEGEPISMDSSQPQAAGENIADCGGIRNAFRAYKKWEKDNGAEVLPDVLKQYTHDQLFFISFANEWCTTYRYGLTEADLQIGDVHSPAKYRIIGSLSNFEEFGKAFNCPSNSRMVPEERCELW